MNLRKILLAVAIAAIIPLAASAEDPTTSPAPSTPSQGPISSTTAPGQPGSSPATSGQTSRPSTTPPGQGSPSRGGLPNNPAAAGAGGSFTSMDTNGDKRLSKSEVAADESLSRDFMTSDKNRDGYLDHSEYAARSRAAPDSARRPDTGSNPHSNNTNPTEGRR
jgi:hypothetical protein